jgi:hypothetical protein
MREARRTAFNGVLHTSQRISCILAKTLTYFDSERTRPIRNCLRPSQCPCGHTIRIAAQEIPLLRSRGRRWRRGTGRLTSRCSSNRGGSGAPITVQVESVRAAAGFGAVARAGHVAAGISVRGGAATVSEDVVAVC